MKVKIEETLKTLRERISIVPEIAVVLGSGLGDFANLLENQTVVEYADIPHFPLSTVQGHKGRLVCGKLVRKHVAVMQGRFHYYEGYSMAEITFPIRVLRKLGCNDLILTNAAGGINRNYAVGDLMVISDHINFMGDNPLRGPNDDETGPRFPAMQDAYTPELVDLALKIGRKQGAPVQKGVYIAVAGPNYETAAELRAFRIWGADAVGMSTVPEVLVGVHSGYKRICGISCITDMATGESHESVNHKNVVEAAVAAQPAFLSLLKSLVEYM